jgi:hypothetical protein
MNNPPGFKARATSLRKALPKSESNVLISWVCLLHILPIYNLTETQWGTFDDQCRNDLHENFENERGLCLQTNLRAEYPPVESRKLQKSSIIID